MNTNALKKMVFPLLLAATVGTAEAADKPEFTLVIKDHKFQPAELVIPAGVKVVIIVDNQDPTPEEFESHELHLEKVIPGMTKGKVFVRALEPGTYPFFGEFNPATAQGKLIVQAVVPVAPATTPAAPAP